MIINSLTTKQVVIRIIAIVSLVEFLVMSVFAVIDNDVNPFVIATVDIILLAALSTPLIFFLVITPFVKARDDALDQLSYQAITDPLTKLSNRRSIYTKLETFMASAVRHKFRGAIFLLDLDGFKFINDAYGHDSGDAVLVEIANRLRSRVRVDEVVGRLGGDEFILVINHLDANGDINRNMVSHIGEELVTLLSQPVYFNDKKLPISVSIGVRVFGHDEIDVGSAIKDADIAMYRAKVAGKGQCVVFEG
ncbi:MAG TPA: GGDEF domain-containing protein [Porticoccus sp.]|nr:GGDEF domain-containing protein [Porticoccus sp.]